MTDEIRPALTPEEWARVGGSPTNIIADNGRVYFEGHRPAGISGTPALSVVPNDEKPALIALANASLPDSDPRKITRDAVAVLRSGLSEVRAHSPRDTAIADRLRCAKNLLDALESYLPPETP